MNGRRPSVVKYWLGTCSIWKQTNAWLRLTRSSDIFQKPNRITDALSNFAIAPDCGFGSELAGNFHSSG